MRDISNDEAMAKEFREDPDYAVEFLNRILEDGEQSESLIVLRIMAKAFCGVQSVAGESAAKSYAALQDAFGGMKP